MTTTRFAFAGLMAVALISACAPIVRRHGYVPTSNELSAITPGVTTRAAALESLPPPTTSGVQGSLYYVASQFETLGPLRPRETRREVVAITVGPGEVVTGVERYGLSDGRVVPLSRRVTSDNVTDTTFLRQLMGNLGRFDASSLIGSDG